MGEYNTILMNDMDQNRFINRLTWKNLGTLSFTTCPWGWKINGFPDVSSQDFRLKQSIGT